MPCRCRPPSRRFLTPLSTCWPAATPSSWPPPWHRHPTRPCCMRTSPRCVPAPPWYRCACSRVSSDADARVAATSSASLRASRSRAESGTGGWAVDIGMAYLLATSIEHVFDVVNPDPRSFTPAYREGMAHRGSGRARQAGSRLPNGPVAISTGTAEVVRDGPWHVTLLVNGVPSSSLDLANPTWLDFEYMQQMATFLDQVPAGPLTAVHLGAGGCTLPRWLEAVRPGSSQLAVDVDAELVRLVRDWFDLPRAPRLRLRAQDARAALEGLPDHSAARASW